MSAIKASAFYGEYHGHTVSDLTALYQGLVRVRGPPSPTHHFVWLVGDSSLDNKYWILSQRVAAVNGYEQLLSPARSVPDIAHCLNAAFALQEQQQQLQQASGAAAGPQQQQQQHRFTVINCSVEESTVGVRESGTKLLPQDAFVRDTVSQHDIVLCSLGGNDIALKPTVGTILSIGWLAKISSTVAVKTGTAWGLGHLRSLFGEQYEGYLRALFAKTRPLMLVPSMIYYMDMNAKAESWANFTLGAIGYNAAAGQAHVQALIDRVYEENFVRRGVQIQGVKIVAPVPLSLALDGKTTTDYVARVEPSATGGVKIAALYVAHINRELAKFEKQAAAEGAAGAASSKALAAARAAAAVQECH